MVKFAHVSKPNKNTVLRMTFGNVYPNSSLTMALAETLKSPEYFAGSPNVHRSFDFTQVL